MSDIDHSEVKQVQMPVWQDLLDLMTHADPKIRDGVALEQLAEGILSGRWRGEHDEILAHTLTHFTHAEVQARTFAPLVLCWLMQAGCRSREIFAQCSRWYLSEQDVRGYDPQLGWLHAVAHGADCLGCCGQYQVAHGDEVLRVLAERIVKESPSWTHQEDARIALALIRTLRYQPDTELSAFFNPLREAVRSYQEKTESLSAPTGMPAWLTNLRMTIATLYLCASEGAFVDEDETHVPQADQIKENVMLLQRYMLDWVFPKTIAGQ